MRPKLKEWLEYIGMLLGFLALIFAVDQYKDSKNLMARTKELSDEASTKYMGSFPGNIDQIVPVVKSAQKELIILTDFPGYGAYYDPIRYRRYEEQILQVRKVNPSSRVRMLIFSNAAQYNKLREQFDPKDWVKTTQSAWFKNFFGTFHIEREGSPTSYDKFISRLLEIHAQYERMFCNNGVEVEHVDSSNLFFWVEDDDSAVFAINNRNGVVRELSFRTSDGKLIKSFSSMFERLWEDNKGDAHGCRHQRIGTQAD
jgi:hypothetical protein